MNIFGWVKKLKEALSYRMNAHKQANNSVERSHSDSVLNSEKPVKEKSTGKVFGFKTQQQRRMDKLKEAYSSGQFYTETGRLYDNGVSPPPNTPKAILTSGRNKSSSSIRK